MAEKEKKSSKKKSAKKSGSKVREMTIRRAHGGFVATHRNDPEADGTMSSPEEHVLSSSEDLQNHVADHFPDEQEGAEPSPQASPAPQGM